MNNNIIIGCRQSTSLVKEILETGSMIRIKVTGNSMKPSLSSGDMVTVKKVRSSSLIPGDLIFFINRYQDPVLHRLIRKTITSTGEIVLLTKGDALAGCDEPFREDQFLGKVCIIEKMNSAGQINLECNRNRIRNFLFALFQRCKTGILVFMKPSYHIS